MHKAVEHLITFVPTVDVVSWSALWEAEQPDNNVRYSKCSSGTQVCDETS